MRVRSKFSRALSAHALSSFRYCLGASEESSEDLLVKLKVHEEMYCELVATSGVVCVDHRRKGL